jgi:hypothetical protein
MMAELRHRKDMAKNAKAKACIAEQANMMERSFIINALCKNFNCSMFFDVKIM